MGAPYDDSDQPLDDRPSASHANSPSGYRLRVRRLMAGKRVLIADYEAQLPNNGVVLLLGQNGTGKSLLLRAISQLDHGQDVALTTAQSDPVPVATVLDFPGFRSTDRLADIVRKASWFECDADALAENLSRLNVDLPAASTVSEWSLGNRQRVRIAAALASSRKVLLMDEPFRSIDEGELHSLISLLAEDSKQRLIVVSTHRPELLAGLATAAVRLSGNSVPGVPQLAKPSGMAVVQIARRVLKGKPEDGTDVAPIEMQSHIVDQAQLRELLATATAADTELISLLMRPSYNAEGE